MKMLLEEKVVTTKELEDILEIPSQFINSYLKINEEVNNMFYKRIGKTFGLTLKGCLKHLPSLAKDYDSFMNVINLFYETKTDGEEEKEYKEMYEELLAKYESLTEKVAIFARECLADISEVPEIIDNVEEPSNSKKTNYVKNTEMLPEKTDAEKEWSGRIAKETKEKAAKNGTNTSSLMRNIYRIMRDEYGIVFDQDKKELRESFDIDEDAHISTLYIVSTNDQYRSIYESILETRY